MTAGQHPPLLRINSVQVRDVWGWLDRAWSDICGAYLPSLCYGLMFVALGLSLTGGLLALDMAWAIMPLLGGFFLVGPILGIGLCEISRVLEAGGRPSFPGALLSFRRNPQGLLFAGLAFTLLLIAWIRLAALLFALTFPYFVGGWTALVHDTLTTLDGLMFAVVTVGVGALFAVAAFVIGVVALPVMLDQRLDFFSAALLSVKAVRANPGPLALWAVLIALFVGAGLASALIGLVPSLMLIGHATWHAYRDLITVVPADAP